MAGTHSDASEYLPQKGAVNVVVRLLENYEAHEITKHGTWVESPVNEDIDVVGDRASPK